MLNMVGSGYRFWSSFLCLLSYCSSRFEPESSPLSLPSVSLSLLSHSSVSLFCFSLFSSFAPSDDVVKLCCCFSSSSFSFSSLLIHTSLDTVGRTWKPGNQSLLSHPLTSVVIIVVELKSLASSEQETGLRQDVVADGRRVINAIQDEDQRPQQ